MFLKLAWRNIWRNRNRSLITMASIASAVLLAVVTASLQKGVFDNLVRNVVSLYTGHIQIHAKGYWDEQTLDNCFELSDTLTLQLKDLKGVVAAAPRLEVFSLVSGGEKTRAALVVGVSPAAEDSLTHLRAKLIRGKFFNEEDAALLAKGLADKLGLDAGDTMVLLAQGLYGSTAAGKFVVSGLLHFGSPELNERVVYLPLSAAQFWLDAPNRATAFALSVADEDALRLTANALRQRLPAGYEVMTWEEMMPELTQHIKTDTASMTIFTGILYLIISFGIFSTLLMMFAERQREFGMLVALGMQPVKIARTLLAESVLLTLSGSLAGLALSLPATWHLTVHPIRFGGELAKVYERFGFEPVFPATIHPPIFFNQTLVILLIGLVLAMYPAVRILKLKPVEAMRR